MSELDDPTQVLTLSRDDGRRALAWIAARVTRPGRLAPLNSYSLKHVLENETRLYLTNGAFKGAMLLSGWTPRDWSAQNWNFDAALRPALGSAAYDREEFQAEREALQNEIGRIRPAEED